MRTFEEFIAELEAQWAEDEARENKMALKKTRREDHKIQTQTRNKIRKQQNDIRHSEMDEWTYAKSIRKNK